MIRKGVASILRQAGFSELVLADSARAVLDALEEAPADLVLLDIGLDDADGLTVARRIDAPIVFVSARSDDATLARVADTGALGFSSNRSSLASSSRASRPPSRRSARRSSSRS